MGPPSREPLDFGFVVVCAKRSYHETTPWLQKQGIDFDYCTLHESNKQRTARLCRVWSADHSGCSMHGVARPPPPPGSFRMIETMKYGGARATATTGVETQLECNG